MHSIFYRPLYFFSLLLSNKCQTLKIADFGTVCKMDNIGLTMKVGTIIYMAPEVFNSSNYTTKCDVFSFGITLCEMFTRHKPYTSEIRAEMKISRAKFMKAISKIDSPLRPNLNLDVPEIITKMIKR